MARCGTVRGVGGSEGRGFKEGGRESVRAPALHWAVTRDSALFASASGVAKATGFAKVGTDR